LIRIILNQCRYGLDLALLKFEGVYFDNNEQLCITSLQIAEQTGKDHSKVMRDIRNMLDGLEIGQAKFGQSYLNSQNKSQPMFVLPEREAMILASGYDISTHISTGSV